MEKKFTIPDNYKPSTTKYGINMPYLRDNGFGCFQIIKISPKGSNKVLCEVPIYGERESGWSTGSDDTYTYPIKYINESFEICMKMCDVINESNLF